MISCNRTAVVSAVSQETEKKPLQNTKCRRYVKKMYIRDFFEPTLNTDDPIPRKQK